jgi:hypothetical protein
MKAFPNTRLMQQAVSFDNDEGMDLRDYFAIHANDYDIYKYMYETRVGSGISASTQIRTREEARYAYADAMMKARKYAEVDRNNTMPDRDSTNKS